MKKISSGALALTLIGTMLPSAFAVDAPVSAPSNGFIQAENPEWTSAHQISISDLAGHRQYHRDAVTTLTNWYAVNAPDRGTMFYNFARRIMLQERNLMHRLYHMGLTIEDTLPASSSSSSYSSSYSSSTSSSQPSSSSSSSSSLSGRDTTNPSVETTFPGSQTTNAALNTVIIFTFSEDLRGSTVTENTFTLTQSNTRVNGRVTFSGRTVTFTPTTNLIPNMIYTATAMADITDLAGNRLGQEFRTTFTTGQTMTNVNHTNVSLGAASTFAVLAGSTVTNTGPTNITGDLGVSAGTAVTGFAPGTVTSGSIHSADTLAGQAQASLTVAYNDLAGRSTAPVSIAGNLGGMTLAPGLYKSTSGIQISSGDLTLDAKGNPNAIFIFQVASTLDVSAGRSVRLIDGAKAANVYWQVGTSANLGTSSVFKGSILADQSISLQTSASVEGRLLARIGAVTMQSNTIVVPAN